MKHKDEIKKELRELSSFLADMDKPQYFKVPESYFDNLTDQVLDRINAETPLAVNLPTPEPKQALWVEQLTGFLQSLFQPRMALSLATLALLIIGAFAIFKQQATDTGLAEITAEDAEFYLAQNLESLDDDLLYELVGADGPDFLNNEPLDESLLEDLLEEYLDELDETSLMF